MRLLKATTQEEVDEIFLELAKESEALIDQITDICWYMRGSINWDQAWDVLSYKERRKLFAYINKLIERVTETKMPLL
jgi:hypothetical protein